MRNKFVVYDPYGALIRMLIFLIIWYKEAIQGKFYTGSNVFITLGLLLAGAVYLDCGLRGGSSAFIVPRQAFRYFIYAVLTFIIGFISSPKISNHISYGITIVEFSLVMLCVCYYVISRDDAESLIWNFVVVYIFMLIVFLRAPVKVLIGGVVRYSYGENINPNGFAVSMSFGIWSILYMVSRKKINLLVGLPICGLMLYAIILSGAKKGLIASLLILFLWFALYYIPQNQNGFVTGRFGKVMITLVLSAAMLSILSPLFTGSVLSDRFSNILSDESTTARINMYRIGFDLLNSSPLLGKGYWGFAVYYGAYSHSTWVEAFVSSGYPLGLFFVSIYFNIGKEFVSLFKYKGLKLENRAVIIQHLILFCALLFFSVCTIHFFDLCTMIYLGMMMSVIHSESKKIRGEDSILSKTNEEVSSKSYLLKRN